MTREQPNSKALRRTLFRRMVAIWTDMGTIGLPLSVARELWRATRLTVTYH